jgi:hypothetical protein
MEAMACLMVIVLVIAAISALTNREYLWSVNFTALAFMGGYLILERAP